tara:strand:- start:267 stop:398 length:132 start_codon:yes stop_codon:yes gene_type:complete
VEQVQGHRLRLIHPLVEVEQLLVVKMVYHQMLIMVVLVVLVLK